MEELPLTLLDGVPASQCCHIQGWWNELSHDEQVNIAWLCDERWEEQFFRPFHEDTCPPSIIGGRFLAHDDAWQYADWEVDWREYLIEHQDDLLHARCHESSVMLSAQFHSVCYLGDEPGVGCRLAEWSLTRFAVHEWPPSEQR